MPFLESLELQPESTRGEFENRASDVLLQLAEQGLNAQLYYRNKDFKEYASASRSDSSPACRAPGRPHMRLPPCAEKCIRREVSGISSISS